MKLTFRRGENPVNKPDLLIVLIDVHPRILRNLRSGDSGIRRGGMMFLKEFNPDEKEYNEDTRDKNAEEHIPSYFLHNSSALRKIEIIEKQYTG